MSIKSDFDLIFEHKIRTMLTPVFDKIEKLEQQLSANSQKEYLSAKEVASIYSISRSTLNRYCNAKKISKYYMGDNKTLFKKSEIDALLFKG